MILTSIQIQGFKSFADKTVLKFGKGITAVVGPNGSGKSNISDAVRWVLGEQSTKSLRGQSMEDVIFGGTADRRPHGFCEVTLNIDNSDRSLNFDNDSVSVTRRYYRSHESEYQINNVSVRLKDINELFMDTGLGRDGYSMIGQGKIDNIISSKSDERRDIFEEASGISKYRYRKTEAERKLSAAEDNLLRLKDIMSELESRVGPLEIQSKKAEKFFKLSEEKKQLEISLWIKTLNNSKEALRNHESKINTAKLHYNEIEEALSEFDRKNEQNSLDFSRLTAEIEDKRNSISSLNEEIVKLKSSITVLSNDILHNNENEERLSAEKEAILSLKENGSEKIFEFEEQIKQKESEISDLNSKLTVLQNDISKLLIDSEKISQGIEERIKRLNSLTDFCSDKRVELVSAETSIAEITSRFNDIDNIILQNSSEKDKLLNELEETKRYFEKTEEDITSDNNVLNGYEIRLAAKIDARENIKTVLEKYRLDIEEKKRRVNILTELENSMEGFSGAVKYILGESEKGILRGIHCTVAKAIKVDKKYSVAIETALGNNIQNIIVETEADAKRAINALKNNKIGRATFMPINSVKAREFKESGFDDVFGFVGIASDLVDTNEKYSEIIRYLLGGAVITEDIDSAVVLAKKYNYRIKVVSLDGQVINPGGTMTGGSHVKQAGLLSRTVDIERYNSQIVDLEAKLSVEEEKYNNSVNEVAVVEADIKAVKDELITLNEDKIRIISEVKHIESLIGNIDSVIDELSVEKTESDKKISLLNNTAESVRAELDTSESEKSLIQSEIDEMTGGRQEIFNKRDNLNNEITDLKLSIINAEKDKTNISKLSEELEKSMSDNQSRLIEIESQIAAVSFKNEQINKEILGVNDEIDNLNFSIDNTNNEISKLLENRNNTEKLGVELRSGERERILEREKIGGELARLNERKDIMVKEYDDYIKRLFDDYQLTKTEAEEIATEIEKPAEAKKQLSEIKSAIRALGNVNVAAIEEYKEVKERFDFMSEQISDVENSKKELLKLINQLTAQMQELFVAGFEKINGNFQKTFKDLFGGGSACLKLTEPENVLESGIDIEANLPGKNVPSLDGLSGGEKALVALSIYFSIMLVNPPPFCFLDEVDTALDDINVDRFADYMKDKNFSTQFICVTHRRGTMEAADMLYGVTMQEKGITKLLELNVSELVKKLKLEEKSV